MSKFPSTNTLFQLYRSISDSEINFCIKEDEVEKEPSPKHRNYSVMNKTIPQPNGDAKKVNKKYSIIKDSLTKTNSNGFEVIILKLSLSSIL